VGGRVGRELSEVLSWGGTGVLPGEYQGLGWAWVRIQGANDAGRRRGPHCLSVCLGKNYKALEAPADGFSPAFLWAPEGGNGNE
jgi:hypothetical protein